MLSYISSGLVAGSRAKIYVSSRLHDLTRSTAGDDVIKPVTHIQTVEK